MGKAECYVSSQFIVSQRALHIYMSRYPSQEDVGPQSQGDGADCCHILGDPIELCRRHRKGLLLDVMGRSLLHLHLESLYVCADVTCVVRALRLLPASFLPPCPDHHTQDGVPRRLCIVNREGKKCNLATRELGTSNTQQSLRASTFVILNSVLYLCT